MGSTVLICEHGNGKNLRKSYLTLKKILKGITFVINTQTELENPSSIHVFWGKASKYRSVRPHLI